MNMKFKSGTGKEVLFLLKFSSVSQQHTIVMYWYVQSCFLLNARIMLGDYHACV